MKNHQCRKTGAKDMFLLLTYLMMLFFCTEILQSKTLNRIQNPSGHFRKFQFSKTLAVLIGGRYVVWGSNNFSFFFYFAWSFYMHILNILSFFLSLIFHWLTVFISDLLSCISSFSSFFHHFQKMSFYKYYAFVLSSLFLLSFLIFWFLYFSNLII